MLSVRMRTIMSSLMTFFEKNKKVIISAAVLFAIGIVLGVILAFKAVDGEFERVPRCDVETGAGKVFFIAILCLAGGYGILLVSGVNNKTVFLACIPFVVIGFFFGRYSCALVGRFEGFGVINLLVVYLPFFLISFVLMMIAATNILSAGCTDCCEGSTLKPSFTRTLKIFGINVGCSLVIFLIFGSMTGGVIIVTLF